MTVLQKSIPVFAKVTSQIEILHKYLMTTMNNKSMLQTKTGSSIDAKLREHAFAEI